MLQRTDAIVLRTTDYGDADLIVTWFTRDLGLRKGFAKGARKFKSRFGSSMEPFSHVRLSLHGREGAELPRVTQADILNSFYTLREELPLLMTMAGHVQLITGLLHEGEPHQRKFSLYLAALKALEESPGRDVIDLAFRIKFLWMAGYGPRVSECGVCGRAFTGDYGFFFPEHGALICRNCTPRESTARVRLRSDSIDFFRTARASTFEQLSGFDPDTEVLTEVRIAVDRMASHLTGKKIGTAASAG